MYRLIRSVRFHQFSLRTGVIFFLLISILFGVAAHLYHDVIKRGEVQRLIAKNGLDRSGSRSYFKQNAFTYSYAPEPKISDWTKFIRQRVHPEYERKFQHISIDGDPLDVDPRLDLSLVFGAHDVELVAPLQPKSILMVFGIRGMKRLQLHLIEGDKSTKTDWIGGLRRAVDLETLDITGAPLTRELAEGLSTLPKLQNLQVAGMSIDALPALCKIENLTKLHFPWTHRGVLPPNQPSSPQETEFLHEGFMELAKRTKLTELHINNRFPLKAADLTEFCSKSPLRVLNLKWTDLDPECLKELARLPNLQELDIHEERIGDEHLQWLTASKSLKSIRVAAQPTNSPAGLAALREKMPHCNITRN